MVLDWLSENNWIILVAVIALAIVIGGLALLIHKILNKDKKDDKPTEEEIANETMERYLEDVESEETQKQFEEFENEIKEEENK